MEDRISAAAAEMLNTMIFEKHYGKERAKEAMGLTKHEGAVKLSGD